VNIAESIERQTLNTETLNIEKVGSMEALESDTKKQKRRKQSCVYLEKHGFHVWSEIVLRDA